MTDAKDRRIWELEVKVEELRRLKEKLEDDHNVGHDWYEQSLLFEDLVFELGLLPGSTPEDVLEHVRRRLLGRAA